MNVPVKRLNDGTTNYFPMCVLDSVFLNSAIEVKNTLGGIQKGSTLQKNTSLQTVINKLLAIEGTDLEQEIANKVDKVPGKGLSTNDFTTELKQRLQLAITEHQDISGKVDKEEGKRLTTNDFTDVYKNKLINALTEHQDISGKVDKIEGMGLSTNDFTDALKAKLVALSPTIAYDDTELRTLISGKLSIGDIQWTLSETSIYPVQSKVLYSKISAMDTKDNELEEAISDVSDDVTELSNSTSDVRGAETIVHTTNGLDLQTWHDDVKWLQLDSDLTHKCGQNIKAVSIQSINNINDVEDLDLTGKYRLLLFINEGDFLPSDSTTRLLAVSTNVTEITGGADAWNTWDFNSINIPRSNCKLILIATSQTHTVDTILSWSFTEAVTNCICFGTKSRNVSVSTDNRFLKRNGNVVSADLASIKITCKDSSYISGEVYDLNNRIEVADSITTSHTDGFYSISQWIQLDKSEFKHTAIKSISIRSGNTATANNVKLVLYSNYGVGSPTNENVQFVACSTNSVTLQGGSVYNTWNFNDAFIPADCHMICMLVDSSTTGIEDYDWDRAKTKYKNLSVSVQFVSGKTNDIVCTTSEITNKLANIKFTYSDNIGELKRQISTKYTYQFPEYWADDLNLPGLFFYQCETGIYTSMGASSGLIGEHSIILTSGSNAFLYAFESDSDGKVTYSKFTANIDIITGNISIPDFGFTLTKHRNPRWRFNSVNNSLLLNGKSDMEIACLFKEDVATSVLGYDLYEKKSYNVGDVVYHNNKIYKCTTDIEDAEDWDEDHWSSTTDKLLKSDTLVETVLTAVESMDDDQKDRFKAALGL